MTERSHLMDGLRVGAAHLIVLHHLVSYGPLASTLAQTWPALHEALFLYGRFATQVFLVMAGYWSAQGLLSASSVSLGERLRRRYWRLVPPFALAIVSVALVVSLLRPVMPQDWLTDPPSVWQWLAHVLLIQDLVEQPSMTVGAWYVAIDFQLFAVLSVLVWALLRTGASHRWVVACVAVLCLVSQWYFNRDPDWDRWAWYFMESYGVGVLLAWSRPASPVAGTARGWLLVCLASALAAGWIYPRPRLWLTVSVCALLIWGIGRWQPSGRCVRALQRHSDTSYALFLTHFAPLVVANALWTVWAPQAPLWGVLLLALTWWGCVVWAGIFHRSVETLMRKAWRR
jgi:peptidoglycan/LPS O-acetylase OafA/YrhL